jgi:hypothetical protein
MRLPSPDDRWVIIVNHGVIPAGTKYLVIEELDRMGDGWLLCWRDGIEPRHSGTLLHERHVEDEEGNETRED